jgi:S-(hydroxymethyl)glutathione dehydrogenase/alcohol dehydrogenase
MKTRGAIIKAVGQDWEVVDLELGEPNETEVLIEVHASGLCHSDAHLTDGDLQVELPFVGGHEGAGIVKKVGSKVTRVQVGDHVCTSFIPVCGVCKWCTTGRSNLCKNGYLMEQGKSMDGTYRFSHDGKELGALCRLGTFSDHIVCSEQQAIKIDDDIPLDVACLVSCGVATGFGAATNVAEVKPGDVVLIVGMGGVGVNAVQGAAAAGATHVVVVDPIESKRERAAEFGATATFASIAEALPYIHERTEWQGTDATIITVDRAMGDIIAEAFRTVAKSGSCVLVALGPDTEIIPLHPQELQTMSRSLKGVMFGDCNPIADIPSLLAQYKAGKLKLDELVTTRYSIEDVNQGFADMKSGKNIRGVIVHDHAAVQA